MTPHLVTSGMDGAQHKPVFLTGLVGLWHYAVPVPY